MPTTLQTELTNLSLDLDDASFTYYTSTKLTLWINQGCEDIARRAECLLDTVTTNVMTNQNIISAPPNTIRIHEVTFSPNDPTQIYPLTYKGRQEMNQIWAVNQMTPASYPSYYTTWSQPPYITLQVYPIPAQAGIIQYWYYRMPKGVVNSSDLIDLPDGYISVLRAFARYCARRSAGDAMWQDDKAIYEEGLSTLITNSRNWTDSAGTFAMGGMNVPGWLYGGWGS